MSKFRKVWSIEEERKQAEQFALRAMYFEEMGMDDLASLFRLLVELCDKKIEIHAAIRKSPFIQALGEVRAEKLAEQKRNAPSK